VPPSPTPPPLAATVNGEYITLAEFEIELAQYQKGMLTVQADRTDTDARKLVREDMIANVLLSQAARRAGHAATASEVQQRIAVLEQQTGGQLSKWKTEHGYNDEAFERALRRAIESAWMRDSIIADVPENAEQVHVRQILAYNAADAHAVLELLRAGADFDELAARSDPVTRGELGWVPPGYLLDENANQSLLGLQAGQHTDVVETVAGFHVFKVIEREVHRLSPDALLKEQQRVLTEWLAAQRQESDITVFVQ
jgi:parvulin-like peptidyl-prolyl isomerase